MNRNRKLEETYTNNTKTDFKETMQDWSEWWVAIPGKSYLVVFEHGELDLLLLVLVLLLRCVVLLLALLGSSGQSWNDVDGRLLGHSAGNQRAQVITQRLTGEHQAVLRHAHTYNTSTKALHTSTTLSNTNTIPRCQTPVQHYQT